VTNLSRSKERARAPFVSVADEKEVEEMAKAEKEKRSDHTQEEEINRHSENDEKKSDDSRKVALRWNERDDDGPYDILSGAIRPALERINERINSLYITSKDLNRVMALADELRELVEKLTPRCDYPDDVRYR
jgi:hypothetical protein